MSNFLAALFGLVVFLIVIQVICTLLRCTLLGVLTINCIKIFRCIWKILKLDIKIICNFSGFTFKQIKAIHSKIKNLKESKVKIVSDKVVDIEDYRKEKVANK